MTSPSPGCSLPPGGRSKDDVLAAMRAVRKNDLPWREGRVFSLVYNAGEEVEEVQREAYLEYFSENGLNPTAFPSLKKFESEVIAMLAGLLNGGADAVGNLTSGGTESVLMAVYAAREFARSQRPEVQAPEIVLPSSAHPAFDKAGHYFGVTVRRVAVGSDFRADPSAMEEAITPNTILLVGSAPSYPHGVVDPIAALGEIAARRGLLLHVDACVGGMMLPFVRRLGYPAPDFDFCVPGVTSISVDLHKYGYTAKGASAILYRNRALRRKMFFATIDWSGGMYASPAMAGTRPGGAIAAAWAVMNFLGEEGYCRLAAQTMQAVKTITAGVHGIPGLKILGNPEMTVLAIASDTDNIYEIGDELALLGWHLDRQQFPPSLHLTLSPAHARVADQLVADMARAVGRVRRPTLRKLAGSVVVGAVQTAAGWLPERWLSRLTAGASAFFPGEDSGIPQRSAALYGLIGSLPNRGDLKELVLDLLDQLTRLPARKR